MKKTIVYFFLIGILPVFSCSNTNAENKKSESTPKKTQDAAATETASTGKQSEGIIGDWKLMLETYDDNNNKTLDEEERKKAFSNNYFYRFSSDGKCLVNFTRSPQGAFKGHYTATTVNNRKKISIYLDEGEHKGIESEYYIISVNKEELVLLEGYGELTFWIFKRA